MNDYLKDNFYTRQTLDRSSFDVNVAACRLILVIMPGLETNAVFQDSETLINRLYGWAENTMEPLQSYATGLLAAAMEVPDINTLFREKNGHLIPIMLNRLHTLQHLKPDMKFGLKTDPNLVRNSSKSDSALEAMEVVGSTAATEEAVAVAGTSDLGGGSAPNSPSDSPSASLNSSLVTHKFHKNFNNLTVLLQNELDSNTQEAKTQYTRNVIPFHPPTTATSQMLVLRYLTSMGEYQEFLGQAFENNALGIILHYIDFLADPHKDSCLAFEALKYLASLLCHKKFALEFVGHLGLEKLLAVPRPSITATGVSVALYYLGYCEDAAERICCMAPEVISALLEYVLWLLGSSHDSGRCHATMFLSVCLQFKVILDEFDRQDGFRKLYNVISILPMLSSTDDLSMNDDEECAARQLVRHVVITMRKYLEAHLYYKYSELNANQLGLLAHNHMGNSSIIRAPKCSLEMVSDMVGALQDLLPFRYHWLPVQKLLDCGGVTLLLKITALSYEWNYSRRFEACRAETVKSALDILAIACVVPSVLQVFCERIDVADLTPSAGINVVLHSAEGEIVSSAEVQRSALTVLVHCVCAPVHRPLNVNNRFGSTSKKRMIANKISEDILQKVWECVRSNNGIIVLLSLMHTKVPITDADCIRGMACRALAGLARCETVRQIISKLPLFTNGELQSLMKDPILQEKRVEHVQFQKYALELMERVSGKMAVGNVAMADIHRANVVAQTKIQYNGQQLLLLMHQELLEKGLLDTAATLAREANLSTSAQGGQPNQNHLHLHQRNMSHLSPYTFRSPSINRSRLRPRALDPGQQQVLSNGTNAEPSWAVPTHPVPMEVQPSNSGSSSDQSQQQAMTPTSTHPVTGTPSAGGASRMNCDEASGTHTPIKLIKKHPDASTTTPVSTPIGSAAAAAAANLSACQRSLQKAISTDPPFIGTPGGIPTGTTSDVCSGNAHTVTLDMIVTEYLKNQHSLCKHPMSTCSQFDLFKPHKCPDPKPNKYSGVCLNFVDRLTRREAGFRNSRHLDRKLIHSNFNVSKTIRAPDNEAFFTCAAFTRCSNKLLLGTYTGDVKVFNLLDSEEEFNFSAYESSVTHMSLSKDGRVLLTSSNWTNTCSNVWTMGHRELVSKWQFNDEECMEFSNQTPSWILGTHGEVATVFDINTSQKVHTFKPTIYNQYSKNRATFCPTDELILSDGVLWDVKGGVEVHKFDKLNQNVSGVFHPNNLEVVANTEVWDLRTFHLLRTVPSLDQCRVIFSPQDVIYAFTSEPDNRSDDGYPYECSYKLLDAFDYSSIGECVDNRREEIEFS